jgi:hypothetical protein
MCLLYISSKETCYLLFQRGAVVAKITYQISGTLDAVKVLSVNRRDDVPLSRPNRSCDDLPVLFNANEPPHHFHFDAEVCLPVLVDGQIILE